MTKKKQEWFGYDKPASFMSAETYRSRRNLISISFAVIVLWGFNMNLGELQLLNMKITLIGNNIQGPFFSITHVLWAVLTYEFVMFASRLNIDYNSWADIPFVTGGGFDRLAEETSMRKTLKYTLSQLHSFCDNSSKMETTHIEDSMKSLINQLQHINKRGTFLSSHMRKFTILDF